LVLVLGVRVIGLNDRTRGADSVKANREEFPQNAGLLKPGGASNILPNPYFKKT
jgi:hypothetical protein